MSIEIENRNSWHEIKNYKDIIDVNKMTRAFFGYVSISRDFYAQRLHYERHEVEAVFVRYQDIAHHVVRLLGAHKHKVSVILCSAMLQRMHEVFWYSRNEARAFRLYKHARDEERIYFSFAFCVAVSLAINRRYVGQLYVPEHGVRDIIAVERAMLFAKERGYENKDMSYSEIFEFIEDRLT